MTQALICSMAYNEQLASRVRESMLSRSRMELEEKEMFGGLCFMLDGKMCICISGDRLMVRLSPQDFEKAAEENGFEPMVHGARQMRGYGYISLDFLNSNKELNRWVEMAVAFNAAAKSSKRKTK